MTHRILLLAAVLACAPAQALKLHEFAAMCTSVGQNGSCTEHPIVQAYVGGALDLVAALQEDTQHLESLYCRDPREFFDIPKIVNYMLAAVPQNGEKNAMLTVIRFLEEQGGCG